MTEVASPQLLQCFAALDAGEPASTLASAAVEAQPQSEASAFHLGLSYLVEKKFRKAAHIFAQLEASGLPDVQFYLGVAAFNLSSFDEAIRHFRECVRHKANDAPSLDYLARSLAAQVTLHALAIPHY